MKTKRSAGQPLTDFSVGALLGKIPRLCQCLQRGSALWPIVKGRGVKIGAVRPDKRVDLGVDPNSVKE
jgi:hypothetical protein